MVSFDNLLSRTKTFTQKTFGRVYRDCPAHTQLRISRVKFFKRKSDLLSDVHLPSFALGFQNTYSLKQRQFDE